MDKSSYTSRRSLLNLIIGGIFSLSARPGRAETIEFSASVRPPEKAAVAAILDGDTLKLADGTLLRLAGIEAPKPDLAPGDAAMARLAAEAEGALKALIGTGPIALREDAGKRDRYGRRLAQVDTSGGAWLQAALVVAGHARVRCDGHPRLGSSALLAIEAGARAAGRGIWRHPVFAVRAADDPKLDRFAGTFQIIAGRVFEAATVKGTGYINFGADRETDLTLVLKKPALDLLGPDMLDLAWLTSKPIRCRGWLDLYKGPRIDISQPEQIEVLEV